MQVHCKNTEHHLKNSSFCKASCLPSPNSNYIWKKDVSIVSAALYSSFQNGVSLFRSSLQWIHMMYWGNMCLMSRSSEQYTTVFFWNGAFIEMWRWISLVLSFMFKESTAVVEKLSSQLCFGLIYVLWWSTRKISSDIKRLELMLRTEMSIWSVSQLLHAGCATVIILCFTYLCLIRASFH